MSPRIYALVLSAVAATVFFGIAAANVIIDPQGRVAGSVLGEVSKTTLYDLVHDARFGPRAQKGGA